MIFNSVGYARNNFNVKVIYTGFDEQVFVVRSFGNNSVAVISYQFNSVFLCELIGNVNGIQR